MVRAPAAVIARAAALLFCKDPGRLDCGSGGIGSAQQLFIELARNAAGIRITHVP